MDIDNETLEKCVTVYCSATQCKFKRDSGYYGSCHNRKTLLENNMFFGGRVYLGGCAFSELPSDYDTRSKETAHK